jgi:hypothetical protein
MRKLFVGAVVAISVQAAVGFAMARRLWRRWGIDPIEMDRVLPGDELVPEPTMSDTRGITIDAPPAAVWPWLLQLGYGRGGWYSYDRLDMRGESAGAIRPELQHLAVGEVVPTDPDGGFVVRALEPERSLVLFVDDETAATQRGRRRSADAVPAGLEASGRFMQTAMPPRFAVSWAIVLEPMSGGRTRLIERVRGRFGEATPGSRALGPVLGFGVFLMTRRQMLGLAERARWTPVPTPETNEPPRKANGHAPELSESLLGSAR